MDPPQVDVAIVGAGLAGTTAAVAMARSGCRVALIDAHGVHPDEFRAEKLAEAQMAAFERLGLGATVAKLVTPTQQGWIYRYGRLAERPHIREYGFAYGDLVNGLRAAHGAAVPPQARLIVGKIVGIHTGPQRQQVRLADGNIIGARLLVVATGLGDAVRRAIGIGRVETAPAHSLSLAVTLARPAAACPFETLTYYGTRADGRMAYLTLFPIGGRMRANVFVYRDAGEPWTRDFRRDPARGLQAMAPEIAGLCGDFVTAGPVAVRVIDLIETRGFVRDGVVLLGDAFCTTCPVPGVGVQRVLTDVERLCTVHLPRWLASDGMASDKIASFYADPVKRRSDARGIAASHRARAMTVGPGLRWAARRLARDVLRRTRAGLAGMEAMGRS